MARAFPITTFEPTRAVRMGIDRFFCPADVLRQKGLRVRSVRWGWFWAVGNGAIGKCCCDFDG
jgi:hypothetical protein